MILRRHYVAVACAVFFASAPPALAELQCDTITADEPLYAAQIAAFGQTIVPSGCDMAWSQAMRARRNAKLSDGIVVREETWGFVG